MGDLKGFAEIAEHLIYEALGLLLPGVAAALLAVAVLAPEAWGPTMTFGSARTALVLAGAYALGYVVQSLSRPVCNLTGWALARPWAVARWAAEHVRPGLGSRLEAGKERAVRWLRAGHAPADDAATDEHVVLADLVHAQWHARLAAPAGRRLRARDIVDLSFSALGDERRRLARLRALTSLCRALAALVALGFWGLLGALIGVWALLGLQRQAWPVTAWALGGLALLWLAFVSFIERADLYDGMWTKIIPSQFLANVGAAASPPPSVAGAGNGTRGRGGAA